MVVAPEPRFRLTPEEDFVFGVRMRGSSLAFGPSGTEVLGSVLLWVMTSLVGGLMVLAPEAGTIGGNVVVNRSRVVMLGLLTIAHGTWLVMAALRIGVVADASGIEMRRFVRRAHLAWGDIQYFLATETAPRRWERLVGPDSVGWCRRPVESWSIGVAVRHDGTTVRLPGFESAARGEGLSLGGPTATELKIAALDRYRVHLAAGNGGSNTRTAPRLIEDVDRHLRWVVVNLTGGLLVWSLTSWAAGAFVDPLLLIVGVASTCLQRIRIR